MEYIAGLTVVAILGAAVVVALCYLINGIENLFGFRK
jgi:hypothetical protein